MSPKIKVILALALSVASFNSVAGCIGYAGPNGPCSTGPGGGLYTGPGGGAYTGPGGACDSGPGFNNPDPWNRPNPNCK